MTEELKKIILKKCSDLESQGYEVTREILEKIGLD